MDADGNTDTHVLEVTVTDVVETSTVTIGGLSDATAPGELDVDVADTDGGAIGAVTWTTYGADAQQFTQGANGTLTLPARDYETPEDADGDGVYVVEVRAVDADANEDTHSIRVTVTDVVETSTVTIGGLSNATTPENASWTSPAPTASGALGAVTLEQVGSRRGVVHPGIGRPADTRSPGLRARRRTPMTTTSTRRPWWRRMRTRTRMGSPSK